MTLLVVVAFVAVTIGTGNNTGVDNPLTPGTTLINKPSLPGDDTTGSTLGGTTARCKDGTYSFLGGGESASDEELCKNNGGVEERLP